MGAGMNLEGRGAATSVVAVAMEVSAAMAVSGAETAGSGILTLEGAPLRGGSGAWGSDLAAAGPGAEVSSRDARRRRSSSSAKDKAIACVFARVRH